MAAVNRYATMQTAMKQANLSVRIRKMLGVAEDPNLKVGINGFGRLGRMLACAVGEAEGIDLVAINDPYIDAEYMAHMLQHDSAPGGYPGSAEAAGDNTLLLNGRPVTLYNERNASDISWWEAGAVYVIEASGRQSSAAAAEAHLKGGAQHVVLAAPSDDCPQIVVGINEGTYKGERVVSNSSSAAHCLSLILTVIDEAFGVVQSSASLLQACSAFELEQVDAGPSGKGAADWRSGRGDGLDIIPTFAEAVSAVRAVLPSMGKRLGGSSFRLPAVGSASVVDLTAELRTEASMEQIREAIATAAASQPLRGRLGLRDDDTDGAEVSSDGRSAIFDGRSSIALSPKFVKLIAWYPNEWGYCRRLVELLIHMQVHDQGATDS